MPYISPDLIAQAKQIDLLTYLQTYEPDELVHVAGHEYSTKTHDSLKISRGMWCWNSRQIGGRSALDYLIKVRGMGFLEAVESILRVAPILSPARVGGSFDPPAFSCPKPLPKRTLHLPPAAPDDDRVIGYLLKRGIDRVVLDFCIGTGRLFQSADYGNAVFVGKGEICRDTGNLLKAKGIEVKVLDLINMWRSHCYNPFVYLREDNDVQRLVTNLFKATTPKGSQSNDPFWDTAASMLLLALIFYLKHEAPEDEQNFPMVMEMLRAGEVREDDDNYRSPLDTLFERLEMNDPGHIAVKYYKDYRSGSAKTLKSIQITLAARLEKFNLASLAALCQTDELDLSSMGERKTALFVIIPDNDTSFNFLVSILYTQLFQQLFYAADHKYRGSLPMPVHFIMDEFANVSLPDDFDKILSVMRSRGVSVSIILQNLAQLKALFEKQHESIIGNCDEFLYLGGNEQATHKFVSELLGKETIDTNIATRIAA